MTSITSAPPYMTTTSAASDFIGYFFSSDGEILIESCGSGSTWTTWSSASTGTTYGYCCTTSGGSEPCFFATRCAEGEDIVNTGGSTYTCPSIALCVTRTVFQQYPSLSPTWNIFCDGETSAPASVYRAIASTTASATASQTSPSSSVLPGSSSSATAVPATTTPRPSSNPQNNAWIAAVVIGPVFAIVVLVLGLLIWRIHRRLRQSENAAMQNKLNGGSEVRQSYAPLPSSSPPQELPNGRSIDAP